MWRHIKLLEQVLMLGRGEAVTGKENEGGFRAASNIYWRRQWHPTPVLLPGKSHGRRSLGGCSPWGRKESDMTEWLHFHFYALEKEMATHSSVLAWRIPGMRSHRVGHAWSDLAVAVVINTWSELAVAVVITSISCAGAGVCARACAHVC